MMQRYRRDEYENLDEYETDEEEEEEEEEEGGGGGGGGGEEMEFLQVRQRMKESIRRKKNKGNGNNESVPSYDYGSFFGPSKPVISQRVIQESKSLLENHHLISRNSNACGASAKNSSAPKIAVAKSGVRMDPPKVMNEVRAQKRQDTYSFLSDDAELPAPTREPPAKRVHPPQPEARSSQVVQKSKQISSSNGRQIQNGREERRPTSMNGNSNIQRKPMPQKMVSGSKSNMAPSASQKQFGSNSANGPGWSVVANKLPRKMPVTSTVKKISTKNPLPGVNRSLPCKNLPLPKQPVQPRREYQESCRSKLVQKQPLASSKPQMNRPVKQVPSHSSLQEHRPKKKPARRYSDENIARDYDDDSSDMEASFDAIQREEAMSEKIARKEDEEELRKIQEEDRKARQRKRKMSQR